MPQVVESGDGAMLERRVLGVHRLKSATPAGAIARMAALIGGGSEEQARAEREALWAILRSRPADRESIGAAVHLIADCGALDACEAEARGIVEDAWSAIDPLVANSLYKIHLRAFGWFVLDRHY